MKKKLALIPAAALAVSGLVATPVAAVPNADSEWTIVDSGQQAKEIPAIGSNSPSESSQADLGVEGKLRPAKITQTDITKSGVKITLKNLKSGDLITNSLTGSMNTSVGRRWEFNLRLSGVDPKNVRPEVVEFEMKVERPGTGKVQTIPMSFEIVKDGEDLGDPDPDLDPKVVVPEAEMSASDFNENGIEVRGEGFTPNDTVYVYGREGDVAFVGYDVEADEEGKFTTRLKSIEGELGPGSYTVEGLDADTDVRSPRVSFQLTADGSTDGADDSADGSTDGANDKADGSTDGANDKADGSTDGANDQADGSTDGAGKDSDQDGSKDGEDPAGDAKLTVSPETIIPTDFVDKKKGVNLSVENCSPGSDVDFSVNPKGDSGVTTFEETVKADDEGKASVQVYGTDDSNPAAYVGEYTVRAICGDEKLNGGFAVDDEANPGGSDGATSGAKDGGSDNGSVGDEDGSSGGANAEGSDAKDSNGNSNGGGSLPRTGAELSGLAAASVLLLVGGAAVTVTLRRRKGPKSPAEL